MSDEAEPSPQDEPKPSPDEPWQEIGRQFSALGDSLAAAFQTASQDEGNRRRLREMQAGLEETMSKLGGVIRDAAASPEGQQAQEEVRRAAHTVHAAGKAAAQEARPHLLAALRQVNAELQKLSERMERSASSAGDSAPPGEQSDPPTG